MVDWHCFKCKERMEETEIELVYMEINGKGEGLRCPKCGVGYITEEIAVDKIARTEKMIEEKYIKQVADQINEFNKDKKLKLQ